MSTYSLKYNDYNANFADGLKSMLSTADMYDITLAVEGKMFKAHQLVLSIFSPYFRELFSEGATKQTIFFMKNVKYRIMKDLLMFMYEGKVEIVEEDLNLFVETANELQIKGLTTESKLTNNVNAATRLKRQVTPGPTSQISNSAKKSKPAQAAPPPQVQMAPTGLFVLPYAVPSTSWMTNPTSVQHTLPYIVNVASQANEIKQETNNTIIVEPKDNNVVIAENATALVGDNCVDDDDDEEENAMCPVKMEESKLMPDVNLIDSIEGGIPVTVTLCKSIGTQRVKGIIWNGYRYCLAKHRHSWSTWRCSLESNYKCKARVVVTDDDRIVLINHHNHEQVRLNRSECTHIEITYHMISHDQWKRENKHYGRSKKQEKQAILV